jgi:hypothetical protein
MCEMTPGELRTLVLVAVPQGRVAIAWETGFLAARAGI